jgi:hypothetical protein
MAGEGRPVLVVGVFYTQKNDRLTYWIIPGSTGNTFCIPANISTAPARPKEDRRVEFEQRTRIVKRRLVILESPFAGDIELNVAYARACVAHSLSVGEAPIASHLLYTQPGILRDDVPGERAAGIEAGLAWGFVAEATVVYLDLGESSGMTKGIERAKKEWRRVERRFLPDFDRGALMESLKADAGVLWRARIVDPISDAVETLKRAGIGPATRGALETWNGARLAKLNQEFRNASNA